MTDIDGREHYLEDNHPAYEYMEQPAPDAGPVVAALDASHLRKAVN